MKPSPDLIYIKLTGEELRSVYEFLKSGEPDNRAINRKVIGAETNVSNLLSKLRIDVKMLYDIYLGLVERGAIKSHTDPFMLGMLSQDLNILNSFYIARVWMKDFPRLDWKTTFTRQDLSKLLADWIGYNRARVGILSNPIDILFKKTYTQPLKGATMSIMQAEAVLARVLKRYTSEADLVQLQSTEESKALDLISNLSRRPTAPNRTTKILGILAWQTILDMKRSREMKMASPKMDPEKIKTKEEGIKAMEELKKELHQVQEAKNQAAGTGEELRELEQAVLNQMKKLGEANIQQ